MCKPYVLIQFEVCDRHRRVSDCLNWDEIGLKLGIHRGRLWGTFSMISCFGYQCGLAVFGFARTRRRGTENRALEATGTTHTYYIAADEVDWNYCAGRNQPHDGLAIQRSCGWIFVENDAGQIGKVYRKAVYREYTHGPVTTLKPRRPEWELIGIVVPVLCGRGRRTRSKSSSRTMRTFSVYEARRWRAVRQSSDAVKGRPL